MSFQDLLDVAATRAMEAGINASNMDAANPSGRLGLWIWDNCEVPLEAMEHVRNYIAALIAKS